jgi:hypothetical protein
LVFKVFMERTLGAAGGNLEKQPIFEPGIPEESERLV